MAHDLTAAVIGTGYMGKKYIDVLKSTVKTLVICSHSEETGSKLAEQYGCGFYNNYNRILEEEKVDFVAVCLPTHLHYSVAKKAMEHNINVLCEKPFTLLPEQACELVDIADEKNLLLMVGHCLRFSKHYEYLKRCITDKRFGELVSLNLFRHTEKPQWSANSWLYNAELSGGVIKDLHIHDTDIILNLLGMPEKVYTIGNDTACNTVYTYSDKSRIVTASASWRNAKGIPFSSGYDAVFENACIKLEVDSISIYTDNRTIYSPEKEDFSPFFQSDDLVENEINYFCNCLTMGLQPKLCSPTDSLMTMFVNYAEAQSMKNHSIEVVPNLKR